MKTLHSVIAIGLVGCLLALPLVEARALQQTQDLPDPALVKQCLKQLGKDTKVKVMVRLANGAKLEGWIGVVGERKFQLRWRRSDSPRHIDYNRVVALSRTGSGDLDPPPAACVELEAQWPTEFGIITDWNNLRQVRIGDKVEVVQHNLSKYKGKMLDWTEESISLRLKNRDVTIPREDVYRVTLLSKNRRLRNSMIGSGFGALVGAVTGVAVLVALGGSDGGVQFIRISTFIGAGVGAGVGAATPTSHPTIYRAPRRKPEDGK